MPVLPPELEAACPRYDLADAADEDSGGNETLTSLLVDKAMQRRIGGARRQDMVTTDTMLLLARSRLKDKKEADQREERNISEHKALKAGIDEVKSGQQRSALLQYVICAVVTITVAVTSYCTAREKSATGVTQPVTAPAASASR